MSNPIFFKNLRRIEHRISNKTRPHQSEPENAPLYPLGKRIERLLVLSFILTVLSFVELYLTTANFQISQDRALVAISSMIEGVRQQMGSLNEAFKNPPTPPTVTVAPTERNKAIERTRKKLGLPPAQVKQIKPEGKLKKTYGVLLAELYERAIVESGATASDFSWMLDEKTSPADLLKKLNSAKNVIENQPTIVWGIESPRLVRVEYAGLGYQFPFDFLSIVFVATLTPLMAGWLSVFYMTRQREILEILQVTDLRRVFPHILNFVPVLPLQGTMPTAEEITFNRRALAGFRAMIVLILIAPAIFAQANSTFLLLETHKGGTFWSDAALALLAVYMFVQVIGLVVQETWQLRGKLFFAAVPVGDPK